MSLILKYKQAFSLRDEIGHCPNLKADIKIIEDSSFFVCPFPISEADKPFMDRQMECLDSLGILTRKSTSHTSPVMLVTRKLTKDKHPVVDFHLLNTRILRRNTSIPLMADVLNILGNSHCECLTCCDLKDAYHSIPISEESKEYCGILPYFGSPIYRYEFLPMGIPCAPQIWMDYITLILNDLDQKSKFIAIMDDLLIHSAKQEHLTLVELLLGTMIKNGLKLSPKKCHFFKTKLTYVGNQFRITNKTMTITPLRSRIEAIQQIPTPRTPKQCKSFCEVVNYIGLFCKDLQCHLRPIVELTRKGCPFHWGHDKQKSFEIIKKQLQEPPILHLPRSDGRVILYSDTSREGTGSSLWQIQDGQARLIGFTSKSLPEPCQRYSVTKLEMTGLLVNMGMWKSIIRHREFDAAVDHAAIAQIVKAKAEPVTPRIKCLLERLAAYSFNLYYVKGKDMILADYLSRHRIRDHNPNDMIPISFYLTRPEDPPDTYPHLLPMQTCGSTRSSGTSLSPVHGADKQIDPHRKPEHQDTVQSKWSKNVNPYRPSPSQTTARKLVERSKHIQRQQQVLLKVSHPPVPIPSHPTRPRQSIPSTTDPFSRAPKHMPRSIDQSTDKPHDMTKYTQ